jgi:putative heme iron utilization protein
MTGIDAEGCDLRLAGETARLEFPEPVTDPEAARAALVRLVKQARGAAA